jgi:predicted ATPase
MLSRDGSNFAAWYRHFALERQDLLSGYLEDLRESVDCLQGLRLEKVGLDTRAFTVALRSGSNDYEVHLDELSDGQRVLLGLYALLRLTAGQGYTLLVDEPDNYLALPEIQPWLVALKDASGASVPQAILTSHHPEVIDYLGVDHAVLLERDEGRATKIKEIRPPEGGPLTLSQLIRRGWLP